MLSHLLKEIQPTFATLQTNTLNLNSNAQHLNYLNPSTKILTCIKQIEH